jgi:hypothetical protein
MAVTGLEISTREIVLGGAAFGAAGAYEKVAGIIRFAVDPEHPLHRSITDLSLAPRRGDGTVESRADFYLLRPVDPARGNRRLLLDVPNRGRKVALGMFNSAVRVPDPTTPADFGNGFLMRHGYTVAWVGWQPDVPRVDGLMALRGAAEGEPSEKNPELTDRERRNPESRGPIVGPVRCEFRPNVATDTLPLADRYHLPQPTVDLDDPDAHLTVREHVGAPAVALPRQAWRFARAVRGAAEGEPSQKNPEMSASGKAAPRVVPDARYLHIPGGFQPGRIYELVYRSQDPSIVGLGLLAVRDTGAFLRFASDASNPCAGTIERAYVFGVSQSGRFLRHLLYLGLTEDERGRDVFDAVIPHVAGARRGEFNLRFGQPSLNITGMVGSQFPFTDGEQVDPVTGARDALLGRLAQRGRIPKIITTNTAAEYWRGDASLVHTDVEGTADVEAPPQVRVYLFAGSQHSAGTLPPPDADPNTSARGRHVFNVVDYAPLLRAALVNLDRWVSDGVEPPPSAVPRLSDGTAVAGESLADRFRAIPGVRFPDRLERPARLDFGPEAGRGVATELPPKVGAGFRTFVPAVDADGNDTVGIRPPELLAPLATFTGWNPRHPDQGAPGDLMDMLGSTLVFARTRAERERRGDPRPSIEERYPSRAAYLERVREAAATLVAARHVLAEDVDAIVERAGRLYDLVQQGLGDLSGPGA